MLTLLPNEQAENFEFDEENAATGKDVARPPPIATNSLGGVLSQNSLGGVLSQDSQQVPGIGGRALSSGGRVDGSSESEKIEDVYRAGPDVESGVGLPPTLQKS